MARWSSGCSEQPRARSIAYTCHYGPEAASLVLLLAGLLACARGRGPGPTFAGGLCFGMALTLRLNFVFDVWLVLPWLRTRRAAASWGVGAALPLAASWWRNHAILSEHPWVFTWDGLATRSADFGVLSTLEIQLHPALGEAQGQSGSQESLCQWTVSHESATREGFETGLKYYKEAINIDPADPEPYIGLSLAYSNAGHVSGAARRRFPGNGICAQSH